MRKAACPPTRRRTQVAFVLGLASFVLSLGSCASLAPSPDVSDTPAHVTFLSEPPGATVFVNGVALDGVTPLLHVAITPGFTAIEMQLEGHADARHQQTFEPDEATRVDLALEALPVPTATVAPTETPTPAPTATRPPRTPDLPRITIHSEPSGARVRLDGTLLPVTTPVLDLEVAPGTHTIEVSAVGFESVTAKRTWALDARDTLHLNLLKQPARVTFTSTPPGATVVVNGVTLEGVTPIDNVVLPAEDTAIEMKLAGYEAQQTRRVWQPNMIDYVDLELVPSPARVTFRSEPPGAEVSVNGRVLGRTTIEAAALDAGKATIAFTLEGHESVEVQREWKPGDVDEVTVVLFGSPGRVRFESDPPWDRLTIDGEVTTLAPGTWLEIPEGTHDVHALRGEEVAQSEFVVQPGSDSTVVLDWRRRRIDLAQYAVFPAEEVGLGDAKYAADNPPRRVRVAAFAMLRSEVTVAQYRQCVEAQACPPAAAGEGCNAAAAGRDNHPINCVGAADAEAYARWKSESTGVPHRLPTRGEWERAARAGGGLYPWGNETPGTRCNSCDAQCTRDGRDAGFDDGWKETAPAALLQSCAGAAGVVDLIGNVAEWTRGDAAGTYEVRGGSWAQSGAALEAAAPARRDANERDATVGFRLMVPQPDWQ